MHQSENKWKALWTDFPLRTNNKFFDVLLLAIPLTAFLKYFVYTKPIFLFLVAALAVIPLAAALGRATEALAVHTGPRVGGLLNATLGNSTELILGLFMLRAGQSNVVKASLSGSIVGNILLVLGMSAFVAGFRKDPQKFTRSTAQLNSTMLFVAISALALPAIFSLSLFGTLRANEHPIVQLSQWTSVILIVVYALGLLRIVRQRPPLTKREIKTPIRSVKSAIVALTITTVLLSLVSDILVDQISAAKSTLGISDLFMGAVVIAIIGNVAEHTSALLMAQRDRMELAYVITVGSSVQIALLVAPLLMLFSLFLHNPMSLLFSPIEIGGIGIAVFAVAFLAGDGETTWFDGVQLIALYLIFALAAYLMPA